MQRSSQLWPIFIVSLAFGLAIAAAAAGIVQHDFELRRVAALAEVEEVAAALSRFRAVYTTKVVNRVRPLGVDVRRDYHDVDGAIPLPATMTKEIGDDLRAGGVSARLYSPYPFPPRVGGLADAFQREAWKRLASDKSEPYYEFLEQSGAPVLRFAVADVMGAGCVDCHNTHPESPKRDWKVGDLRGVLEVTLPMTRAEGEVRAALVGGAPAFLAFLGGAFAILIVVLRQVVRRRADLEREVDSRTLDLEREKRTAQTAEAKGADREKTSALLYRVSGFVDNADSDEACFRFAIETACALNGWSVGHVFRPTASGGVLTSTSIWHMEKPTRDWAFREQTDDYDPKKGEGVVGRAWESRQPVQVDLETTPEPRQAVCQELGLGHATATAVWVHGRVVAVLEFFSMQPLTDQAALQMRGLADALARGLERVRLLADLREAKATADQANIAKSQFLATMSHELRTPLNSIIGFAGILQKNKSGRMVDKELSYLERINSNGKHLLDLINDVLDLSKIEAEQVDLETQTFDLEPLVSDVLEQMEGRGTQRNVSVSLKTTPVGGKIIADPRRLRQVLINLLANAIKFSPDGGVVLVRLVADGDRPLRVDVVDWGLGIPADRLDVVFEEFRQADETTARRFGGTGLGLPIARKLAQAMGFELEVVSREGEGSTFSIRLAEDAPPLVHTPASQRPNPDNLAVDHEVALEQNGALADPDPAASPEGRLVLIIDDDEDTRTLMTTFVTDLGHRALVAPSGETGLEYARRLRPNLITLDLMMPGMDGWATLAALRADPATAEIPVAVVSIVAGEARATMPGIVDFVDKPLDSARLRQLLEAADSPRSRLALVVEDDPDAQELLAQSLADLSIQVELAKNGREGLEKLENITPDFIVLDLAMPEMDGFDFLKRLREPPRSSSIPVFVATSQDLSFRDRAELESARAVLNKGTALGGELQVLVRALLAEEPL